MIVWTLSRGAQKYIVLTIYCNILDTIPYIVDYGHCNTIYCNLAIQYIDVSILTFALVEKTDILFLAFGHDQYIVRANGHDQYIYPYRI
jgi:hypothetical protein